MSKKSSKFDLSIIVPVFNEEGGVEISINEIFKDLRSSLIKRVISGFELIIIDDGSWDNSYKIIQKLNKRYKNIKIVKHITNQGLGASLMTGIRNSSKEYVTYLPADGQAFLREIIEGLKIARLADLVLTYRGKRVDYNPYRHLLSNSLMILMRFFFGLNYKDYNWVHIYQKDLFKHIKVKSKGVFFLGEVVARTYNAGFKILEVEAKYHPRSTGYSKNAKVSVALATLRDLAKLWFELRIFRKVDL